MKFHSTRYAITAAFGALCVGVVTALFRDVQLFPLLLLIVTGSFAVGLACKIVIPFHQDGDS